MGELTIRVKNHRAEGENAPSAIIGCLLSHQKQEEGKNANDEVDDKNGGDARGDNH